MSDKILFVDDEALMLQGVERLLHKRFRINCAMSGEEGLAEIERNGPYCVVISDMKMPKMDGVQFLKRCV